MTKRQNAKRIFLIICLAFAGLVGLRFVLVMTGSSGGGQTLDSPNGVYEALAMSYLMERFWGGTREYYEFSVIDKATRHLIHNIRMGNLDDKPQFWMRGDDKIITWFPDSSEVTFAFQDIELRLKVEGDK